MFLLLQINIAIVLLLFQQINMHILGCDHTIYSNWFSKKQENYQQFNIFTNVYSQLQFLEIYALSQKTSRVNRFFSLEFTFFFRIGHHSRVQFTQHALIMFSQIHYSSLAFKSFQNCPFITEMVSVIFAHSENSGSVLFKL